MTLGITDLIAGIFKPAAELVDELHTSEEEKLKAKTHLLDVQAAAMQTVFEYESKALSAQSSIVEAEAKSEHWLAATWRPILMLTFGGLVVLRFLGFEAQGMTEQEYIELWSLVKIGLTGYIIARSGEKIAKTVKQV